MKLKKILAILLSLMMVFTNVPAIAFADTDVPSEESGETSDDQSYEDALAAAVKAAEEQAAAQQYEIDQNAYEENDDTWTSVDEVVSPELGEPDEEEYAPEPEYEPEPEPEEVPEETAVEEPEQEAAPQPEAEVQNDAPATDAKENVEAPKKEETKVEEAATFASIVTNAKGKLNGLLAAKAGAEAFPAFNGAKNISGTSMKVIVEAPKGAFPEGIQLFAGVVSTPKEVLNAIADDQGEAVSQSDTLSVDIHFYLPEDPNTEIEPLVPINVTFINIDMDAESVDVYHETEKVAEVEGEGGTVELDQFSTYTFVATPAAGNPPSETTDDGAVQLIIPDQDVKLDPTVTNDTIKIGDIATYQNVQDPENPVSAPFVPGSWEYPSIVGPSCSVDPDTAEITVKGLGTTEITIKHKNTTTDDYYLNHPLELTFKVNVTADVTYNGNGGKLSDETTSKTVTYDSNDTALVAANEFTKDYYEFKGWSLTPDGDATIQPRDDILTNNYYGRTLYAVWAREEITIDVLKIWDDNNNEANMRPDKIWLRVFAEGESSFIRSTSLSGEGNEWQTTIASKDDRRLYKYDEEGNLINYTVKEYEQGVATEGITNYEFTIDGDTANGFTITNTYVPEYTTVTIKKVWEDDSEENRPNSVLIRLMNNGEVVKSEYLNETKNWETTFTDIPVKDAAGNYITYYVDEEQVEGYATPVIESEGRPLDGYTFTVTNKYIDTNPPTISITVNKIWDDESNADGIRKSSKIHLEYKPYLGYSQTYPNSERWVGTSDGTVATYQNLPVYNDTGEKMIYFVHEDEIPDGYTVTSTANPGHYTGEAGGADWIGVDAEAVYNAGGSTTIELTNSHQAGGNILALGLNKVWEDEDNIDGKRQGTTITLSKIVNGVETVVETCVVSTDDSMNVTPGDFWGVLPIYENGSRITYKLTEAPIEGYETVIKDFDEVIAEGNTVEFAAEENMVKFIYFVNTHARETVKIPVNKVWEDGDNQDGIRPSTISWTLEGKVGDEVVATRSITWENGKSSTTLTKDDNGDLLPKYYNGAEVVYSVTEDAVEGYDTEVTGSAAEGFTITNTHEPKTITVTAKKVWDDDKNRDKKRPSKITFHLMANGENIGSQSYDVDMSATEEEYEVAGLPMYKNGQRINYVVLESAVPDYTTSYVKEEDDDGNVTWEITNKYEPEKKTITAIKAWNDGDNQDGNRPADVTFKLQSKATGDWKDVESKTVSEANNWTATWTVNKNFKTGQANNEYQYQVVEDETALPDGYTATYAESNDIWTVTNTYEPQTGSLKIWKVWEDDSNRDGLRPATLNVFVTANGFKVPGYEKALTGSGASWQYTFNDLPLYKDGELIEYAIEEELPEGYTATYAAPVKLAAGASKTFKITNKHEPKTTWIDVAKIWDDNDDQDGKRQDAEFTLTAFNTKNGQPVADFTNRDFKITKNADPATIQLTKDGADKPLYENYKGYPINYVLTEKPIDGYTTTIEGDAKEGFTVTNTHEPEKGTLTVIKEWDDWSNKDGFRPDYLLVTLTDQNGFDLDIDAGLSDANGWTYTFTDLPVYKDGVEIIYDVSEWSDGPMGWDTYYTPDTTGAKNITLTSGYDAILTNTHVPEYQKLIIKKVWDDGNNYDKKRPAEVEYTVYSNGSPIYTETLTAADNWEAEDEVPVYLNGERVVYSVVETPIPDYTTSYNATAGFDADTTSGDVTAWTQFEITNKYEPGMTTITAVKEWDDANNQDGQRPDSVEARLQWICPDDGINDPDWRNHSSDPVTLNEANSWTGTWNVHTQRRSTGNDLIFRVIEEEVPAGYEASVSELNGVFTIKNTYKPQTGSFKIWKVWNDDSNRDGLRPASLKVFVTANGVRVPGYETNLTGTGASWEYTFKDLPLYKNGELIKYAFEEEVPEGYTVEYAEPMTLKADGNKTFKVTNTHKPQPIRINVTKIWDDNDDQDGIRKDAEFKLEAFNTLNGDKVIGFVDREFTIDKSRTEALPLTEDGDGNPLYENYKGAPIRYVLTEKAIDGYTTVIEGNAKDGFVVTNTHEPETIDVTVKKVWADEDNQDGIRPEMVEVQLMAGDEKVGEQRLYAANGWNYTFKGLAAYKDGETITYTVEEQPVEGYDAAITDGVSVETDAKTITVTNTHEPKNIDVTVNKIWDDDSNRDKKRPESITLYLMANGKNVASTTIEDVLEKNKQSYVFEKVPALENGKPINYVVFEGEIPEYAAAYEKEETDAGDVTWTITNRRAPDMKTITAIKEWDDNNNQDGMRTGSVTVRVEYSTDNGATWKKMDGSERVLNEENYWKTEWQVKVNNKDGQPNLYKVIEARLTIPEGYEVSYLERNGVWTVTNTHVPETGILAITKIWDDDDNRDGIRPASVTFDIMGSGENEYVREELTISQKTLDEDANEWTDFIEVPKYKNGEELVYYAVERAIEGYEPQGFIAEDGALELDYYNPADETTINEVNNKHDPETLEISIKKVWDDAEDQDGKRPDAITLHLVGYVGSKEVIRRDVTWPKSKTSSVITKDNSLKDPLYKYYEGQEVTYVVTEDAVDGYTTEVTGDVVTGFAITNTHIPETIDVTVTKAWDDENDQDGKRPEYLGITLVAGGSAVGEDRLSFTNNWKTTFTDLPAYENGKAIEYTAIENNIPEYTQTGGDGDIAKVGGATTINLVNEHKPATTKVVVTKKWDDENNYDKKRPDNILYTLYANGRSIKTQLVEGNKTTDEEWGFEFTDLPKYEDGEEIAYTVVEHSIDGYTTVMDQTVNAEGITCVEFTNTYAPGMTTITAVKEWDDENDRDGLRKPVEATLQWKLPEDGFNDWIDHPEPPVVLNEANTWTASWTVHTQRVETGHDLIFQVVEKEVPDGYVASISELDGVWTIKNTHEPETFFIVLEKNWDDDNNRDRMRPESVSFEIMGVYAGKTGDPHVSEEIVTLTKNSVDNDPNVWNMGVEVPAYSNGQEIMYLITEQVPAGYECTAPNNGYAFVVAPGPDDDNPRVSFTNKHEPELVEVRVEKIWDDADDQDGKRPESIRVFVYADGEYAGRQTILNADKEWKATIASTKATKLYKYNNGEEIYYTVKESSSGSSVKPIKDYTTEITGDLWTGFTITNTHVPEEIDINVTKTWDDQDDQDGIRPEYVEVQLMKVGADGTPAQVGDPVRIADPTWNMTYVSLPKYEAGEPVKYYVEETLVDGYETTYDGKEDPSEAGVNGEKSDADTYEYTLNITNSHEVEKTDVGAIKHWVDENNHDKVRPDTILYTLYANGRPVETQSVKGDPTTDEGWDYVFKDLDKNEQGTEIAYMIVEHSVENYTTIIDQEMVEGKLVVEITNKYEPEMTTITAVKEWHDDDNRDGKRADSVEVTLLDQNDKEAEIVDGGSATATLNDANNWATTWNVYTKNPADGSDNVFHVEETTVPEGYQVAYSETQGVFTIKNTHEPAMIDIAVEKTWSDMYDWDGLRPAQLVLKLTANGKLVPGQEISLEPINEFQWTGVFKDLPVYENGKAIEYSVIETVPDGYECYITPFNTQDLIDDPDAEPIIRVQNLHDLMTTNITATKIWDDADDLDGYRDAARKATKLALQVSINGKEYQAADIIFEELEKGIETLKQFIEEVDWLDDDQKAEIIAAIEEAVKESYIEMSKRPHLEIGLDDEELKDDKYTWEGLPVKYHGQDISYRVVEVNDGSDAAKKYTSEVVETDSGMFEITNTHELDKVSHTVSIKWDDNNDQDGLRPAYVNVYLMKDGVRTDDPVVALSPANGWTYTWENLIAGEYTTAEDTPGENPDEQQQGAGPEAPGTAGTKAGYSADEVTPLDPDVYKKDSVTTDGETTIITNKYVSKAISVKGYKYWEDDSNRDGARPQSITLNLYADGDLIKTMDITAENAIDEAGNVWAYEFKDLPRYIDGHLVHYSVSEVAVPNYTLRVEGYDLHNTYTPGKTFMTVIKLWNDDRNRDGIRPDNIIVRLYANGEEINRKSISAASGWFAVFEGLNVMDGQQNVTYTITENAVQDYESSIAGDQKAGYVITNTHTSERTEVPVTKIWDDNDNAAKLRPTGITVNLLVEGRVVDTRILTEADGWKTTFTDLPKYSNGKEVVYTISENPVAGYSSSINGYTITNTLKCAPKKCDDGGHKGTSGGSGRRSGGPKTGDEANITLWIILLIVAAAAIVIARRFRRNTR